VNEPKVPVLVKGSWAPGYGVGCIMNLKSWEKAGSSPDYITDRPPGFPPSIQDALILLNDRLCTHHSVITVTGRTGKPIQAMAICPQHTMLLIDLANALDGLDRTMACLANVDYQSYYQLGGRIEHTRYRFDTAIRNSEFGEETLADFVSLLQRLGKEHATLKERYGLTPVTTEESFARAVERMSVTEAPPDYHCEACTPTEEKKAAFIKVMDGFKLDPNSMKFEWTTEVAYPGTFKVIAPAKAGGVATISVA